MEQIWDAIIIGGGPAGSRVARYAAKGGAKVLVIDSRESIGTPLQCGELVPTNDELKNLCPDVPDIDELFTIPEKAISRPRCTTGGLPDLSDTSVARLARARFEYHGMHRTMVLDLGQWWLSGRKSGF